MIAMVFGTENAVPAHYPSVSYVASVSNLQNGLPTQWESKTRQASIYLFVAIKMGYKELLML